MTQRSKDNLPPDIPEEDEALNAIQPKTDTRFSSRTKEWLTKRKHNLGAHIVYACLVLMALCIAAAIIFPNRGDAAEKGFDAFRLMAMTVLGYIFGSSGNNRD